MISRNNLRLHRHNRIRAKIQGTALVPRVSVFISLNHIYTQLIDDVKGITLVSTSDYKIENKKATPTELAFETGKLLAEKAKEKKIKTVVFDRSGYQYHGKVKALADGARSAGLQF